LARPKRIIDDTNTSLDIFLHAHVEYKQIISHPQDPLISVHLLDIPSLIIEIVVTNIDKFTIKKPHAQFTKLSHGGGCTSRRSQAM
jgi:hypothetical protein